MIDIENEVYTAVAKHLRGKFKSIFLTGEYVESPPKFPAVSLIEIDNTSYDRTQSSDSSENHAEVVYEVNVYANSGKNKSECKAIMREADSVLQSLGFTRIMCEPIMNMADPTIYRMVGRYQGVVSLNKTIYRR